MATVSCFFKLSLLDGRVLDSVDMGHAGSKAGATRWDDFEVVRGPIVCRAFGKQARSALTPAVG
jgi:hypothetical protein